MPPKKKDGPSKKNQEKAKEKVIEVKSLLGLNLNLLYFACHHRTGEF